MSDREDIIETVNRYCWALDLKDCGRLAEVFAADIQADYDGLGWTDLDTMIADMTVAHDRLGGTQHLLGSHLVTVDGDEATCGGWRVYQREARAMWRSGDRRVLVR